MRRAAPSVRAIWYHHSGLTESDESDQCASSMGAFSEVALRRLARAWQTPAGEGGRRKAEGGRKEEGRVDLAMGRADADADADAGAEKRLRGLEVAGD